MTDVDKGLKLEVRDIDGSAQFVVNDLLRCQASVSSIEEFVRQHSSFHRMQNDLRNTLTLQGKLTNGLPNNAAVENEIDKNEYKDISYVMQHIILATVLKKVRFDYSNQQIEIGDYLERAKKTYIFSNSPIEDKHALAGGILEKIISDYLEDTYLKMLHYEWSKGDDGFLLQLARYLITEDNEWTIDTFLKANQELKEIVRAGFGFELKVPDVYTNIRGGAQEALPRFANISRTLEERPDDFALKQMWTALGIEMSCNFHSFKKNKLRSGLDSEGVYYNPTTNFKNDVGTTIVSECPAKYRGIWRIVLDMYMDIVEQI